MTTMPSRRRTRHAIAALRADAQGRARFAIMPLGDSHRRSSRIEEICIDGATDMIIEGELTSFLSALGSASLCHFAQPEIMQILDTAVTHSGLPPVNNPAIDLSDLASGAMARRGLLQAPTSLEELAARHGVREELAASASTCPIAALTLIADLFRPLFLRELQSSRGDYAPSNLDSAFRLPPDDICALAGPPLPEPRLPDVIDIPEPGWRRGAWGTDEALDCALRFLRGASLDELAELTGRSPRSIRARLSLDGITCRAAGRDITLNTSSQPGHPEAF